MEVFDYVIVGAGSAGCVLADRLSEDGTATVCLLEAGPRDLNPFIHIPAGFMKTFYNPNVNWNYVTEPSTWTGGRRISAPRGKTLGGSSSINGHVYNRGQRMDFDTWAQKGNRGWGYADVLPYFRRCESRLGEGDDTFRGRKGGLTVSNLEWPDPLCEAFIEGAISLGMPRAKDYNGALQEGVSFVQRTVKNGFRVSSARAFLWPAMRRPNLRVVTNAHATALLLDGKRATGVSYKKGGQWGVPMEVAARREVILSGGAVNSPQLLQLSGIGPAKLLQDLGIPVVQDLPGVGENLRDHYAPRFVARVKNAATLNEKSRGLRLAGEISKWVMGKQSILSLNPTLVYCFWHSNEATRNNDLQFSFTPASYKEGVQSQLDDFPGMTVASWQQRPESRGYVRIVSPSPFEAPTINPKYLDDEGDRRVLLAGMKFARKLLAAKPLAKFYDGEDFPGPKVQSDDELLEAAKQRGTTTFHLNGTCRMGPDGDALAVVDDQLRVRGIQGLRVADASVMPTMLSANLNAATIMIGDKASDLVRGRTPLEPTIVAA